jgi:hypothetical protein
MHTLIATLFSLAVLMQTSSAAGRVINLVLPRDLEAADSVWLEVKLGAIPRGAEIEIETTSGKMLGVISPHGIRSGDEAGTYSVPVPPEAISGKRLSLRLTLSYVGRKRAPTLKQVKSVRLKITSTDKRG